MESEVRRATASRTERPRRSGNPVSGGGAVESTMRTTSPERACVPGSGDWTATSAPLPSVAQSMPAERMTVRA